MAATRRSVRKAPRGCERGTPYDVGAPCAGARGATVVGSIVGRKRGCVMTQEPSDPGVLPKVQEALTSILAEFGRVCAEIGTPYVVYGGTAIGAVRHRGFIPWDDDADVCMLRPDYERFLAEAPQLLGEGFEVVNSRNTPEYPNMFSKLALVGTVFISEPMKDNPYRMPIALDIFPLDVLPSTRAQFARQSRSTWFWGRLMYLQGTGRPYLGFEGLKRSLVLTGTRTVHAVLHLLGVTPQQLQAHWEKAARRFESDGGNRFADFTDRTPLAWAVTREDLYPAVDMPFGDITVKVPRKYDRVLTRGYGDYMELPPVEERKTHEPVLVELGDGIEHHRA